MHRKETADVDGGVCVCFAIGDASQHPLSCVSARLFIVIYLVLRPSVFGAHAFDVVEDAHNRNIRLYENENKSISRHSSNNKKPEERKKEEHKRGEEGNCEDVSLN